MIPLATSADLSQVERVRELVEGRSCVVVGSAPLPSRYAELQPYETVVAVNGGISSVPAIADVFVLNSKAQDASWPQMRDLHRKMLKQAANTRAGHVLLLRGPKVPSEAFTLARLADMQCQFSTWSVLDKPTKRHVEGEVCGRVDEKKPCSSGMLAAAIVLWCGAAAVRLVGFSLKPGYHYLPKQQPHSFWRDHVEADPRALSALKKRFGSRLCGDLVQQVAA